jgi:hypothetical protein
LQAVWEPPLAQLEQFSVAVLKLGQQWELVVIVAWLWSRRQLGMALACLSLAQEQARMLVLG